MKFLGTYQRSPLTRGKRRLMERELKKLNDGHRTGDIPLDDGQSLTGAGLTGSVQLLVSS